MPRNFRASELYVRTPVAVWDLCHLTSRERIDILSVCLERAGRLLAGFCRTIEYEKEGNEHHNPGEAAHTGHTG